MGRVVRKHKWQTVLWCDTCGAGRNRSAVVHVGARDGPSSGWENAAVLCPKCVTLACLSLVLYDLPAGQAADAGDMPPEILADWIEDNAAEVVQRLAAALRGGAG